MDLADRQGDAVLGLLPRHADFGFGREHGCFHGYGVWMRGYIIGQGQIKDAEGFLVLLSGLQVEPAPAARNDYVKLKPKRNAGHPLLLTAQKWATPDCIRSCEKT